MTGDTPHEQPNLADDAAPVHDHSKASCATCGTTDTNLLTYHFILKYPAGVDGSGLACQESCLCYRCAPDDTFTILSGLNREVVEELSSAVAQFVDHYQGQRAAVLGNGQARRSLDRFAAALDRLRGENTT